MSTKTQTRKQKQNDKPSAKVARRGFSLKDTLSLGLRMQLNACTLLTGWGTTGTLIVDSIARRICQHSGELPASLNYLTVDLATVSGLLDPMKHKTIGVNGAGTLAIEGQKAFFENYAELRRIVERQLVGLRSNDARLPASVSPRKCVEVWVFAGNGGSSGGMQQPAITLINELFQKHRIEVGRINCVFLGADMPVNDITRNATQTQVETVAQTACANLWRYVGDHMSPLPLPQKTPVGDFTIPGGMRVWSLNVMDQSNGHFRLAETAQLIEVVSASYFTAICTHCLQSAEDRVRDVEVPGDAARGFYLSRTL